VLDAIGVRPVSRAERLQEMGIQFTGRASFEPAKARQLRAPFQVDLPVGPRVVFRREHRTQVIANRLVHARDFREAA
jgi:hypothetical protein